MKIITTNSITPTNMNTDTQIQQEWMNFTMESRIPYLKKSWRKVFETFLNDPDIKSNLKKVIDDAHKNIVYPKPEYLFRAFSLCSLRKTRVVIIGQDVYHANPNQAMGLCFSVPRTQPLPPSLKNIFKEITNSTRIINTSGDLTPWAKQGILLLNCSLTVRKKSPGSHMKHWDLFTTAILKHINDTKRGVIFVGWGKFAQSKLDKTIDTPKHLILKSNHPSPLACTPGPGAFLGNNHFNIINENVGMDIINWKT